MATQQLKRDQDFWCTQIQGTRDYQEDDAGFDDSHPGLLLMLLADGMGGYAGGDTASKKAVEVFASSFKPEEGHTTSVHLEYALGQVNSALAETIDKKPEIKGMGCTFVGAVLSHNNSRLHWISVGDSPLWVFRNGSLIRLNADHSKRIELEEQVRKGEITAQEAATNPERNSLTSALTGETPALIDNNSRGVESGDLLLLASDGLFTLSEKEIEQKLSKSINNTAEDIVNKLLGAVKKKKKTGQDNTTVLVVKIPKPLEENLPLEVKPIAVPPQEKASGLKWKYIIGSLLFLLALSGAFFSGKILSEKNITENLNKKSTMKAYSKETDTKKTAPKETGTKKADLKETGIKKAAPKETGTKKAAPKETSTKKADTKKMATGEINPEKPSNKKNSSGLRQWFKALFSFGSS